MTYYSLSLSKVSIALAMREPIGVAQGRVWMGGTNVSCQLIDC